MNMIINSTQICISICLTAHYSDTFHPGPTLSNPCWEGLDQTSSEIPLYHRLETNKQGVARRVWIQTLRSDQRRAAAAAAGDCIWPPAQCFLKDCVMSARALRCHIWLPQFEDLTERSEISLPANPLDQAFVTGAGWALFGEGLALWEQFKMISGI